jgi:hypothetical protein
MYAVVSCPNCKRGKSIIYGKKTTKCPWCGRGFEIFEDLVLLKVETEKEAGSRVAEYNASLCKSDIERDFADFRKTETAKDKKSGHANREGKTKLIERIAKELGKGEFTEEDFKESLEENGLDSKKACEYTRC